MAEMSTSNVPPFQFTFTCNRPTGSVTYTTAIPTAEDLAFEWPSFPPAAELSAKEHSKGLMEHALELSRIKNKSFVPFHVLQNFALSYLDLVEKSTKKDLTSSQDVMSVSTRESSPMFFPDTAASQWERGEQDEEEVHSRSDSEFDDILAGIIDQVGFQRSGKHVAMPVKPIVGLQNPTTPVEPLLRSVKPIARNAQPVDERLPDREDEESIKEEETSSNSNNQLIQQHHVQMRLLTASDPSSMDVDDLSYHCDHKETRSAPHSKSSQVLLPPISAPELVHLFIKEKSDRYYTSETQLHELGVFLNKKIRETYFHLLEKNPVLYLQRLYSGYIRITTRSAACCQALAECIRDFSNLLGMTQVEVWVPVYGVNHVVARPEYLGPFLDQKAIIHHILQQHSVPILSVSWVDSARIVFNCFTSKGANTLISRKKLALPGQLSRQCFKSQMPISQFQCQNCHKIGHETIECDQKVACFFCAGPHHLAACPNANDANLRRCVLCGILGHSPRSSACEVRKAKLFDITERRSASRAYYPETIPGDPRHYVRMELKE